MIAVVTNGVRIPHEVQPEAGLVFSVGFVVQQPRDGRFFRRQAPRAIPRQLRVPDVLTCPISAPVVAL